MSRIKDINEFRDVCYRAAQFLYMGSLVADLPYEKCRGVRTNHRKIGLGLMGVHEWLLQRGYRYEVVPELHAWLNVYRTASEQGADDTALHFHTSKCEKYRCIAPAGTISILAGTTSGIEPVFSEATKRRYLDKDQKWAEAYYIDPVAMHLRTMGVSEIRDTAYSLGSHLRGVARRIKFQADIQEYVDMGISSTVQLPACKLGGIELNQDDLIEGITDLLLQYCTKLKGITFFPDGSRGGQPLTSVSISEAEEWLNKNKVDQPLEEVENSANAGCKGGVCGI